MLNILTRSDHLTQGDHFFVLTQIPYLSGFLSDLATFSSSPKTLNRLNSCRYARVMIHVV